MRLEEEANRWASEFLIPLEYEEKRRSLRPAEIASFAQELGIHRDRRETTPARGLIQFSESKKWKRRLQFVQG